MVRALVLGATGHIGSHIVRALLAERHEVRAAYRTERFLSVLEGLAVERVRVDLETLDGLRGALEGCEWVFHAAGYYPALRERREWAVERGIRSTRRLIERLRQARPSRVVFTSSSSTIRRVPGRAANEQDAEPWPLASLDPARDATLSEVERVAGWRPLYATVKIAMEHEVLRGCRDGLPAVVVNPSVCLGEYDARPFSGRAILAYAKHRVPVYVEHTFNAVYTGDVGVGHVRAAERGRLGERYLLTCRDLTLQEFATLVAEAAGVPPPRWRVPSSLVLAAAAAMECVAWLTRTEPLVSRPTAHSLRAGQRLDGSKARSELSLPQTSIEEAIRRALAWFKHHGHL